MKSKKKMLLAIIFSLLGCVTVIVIMVGIKVYPIYKEYSEIEEIHVNEPIENPDDYGLDYDNILFCCYSYSNDVYLYYWLFFFNDGSVVIGKADRNQLSVFFDAIDNRDENIFWTSMEYTYKGNIGGYQLHKLIRVEEKINYDADYYSTWDEAEKLHDEFIDEEPPMTKDHWFGSNKSPYLFFWKLQKEGGAIPFWEEESDGIIYYLYDKDAEELVYSTIDSSFFDQWMAESWGEDWKDKITIYRSTDDFVVPKW